MESENVKCRMENEEGYQMQNLHLLEARYLHFTTALGSTAKEFGSSSALTATVT